MTILYLILCIIGYILGCILVLLFVFGGTGPGGEEEDARDDYLAYLKYLQNNITSGSSIGKYENYENKDTDD